MRMSSRYTNTDRFSMSLSTSLTKVWKAAGALVRLNGITRYSNGTRGLLKAVFHSSNLEKLLAS